MDLEGKLKKYVDKLKGQTGYFGRDIETVDYFARNPDNRTVEAVRLKVSMLSDRDLTKELATEDMIRHIVDLNVDSRIHRDDVTVVEDIARLTVRGTPKRFLRFASLYCNYHKPEVFPIYSDEHLDLYRQYITKNGLAIDVDQLDRYEVFKTALDHVMDRFQLKEQLNYQEARKLGWLYIDKVVHED